VIPSAASLSSITSKLVWVSADGSTFISTSSVVATEDWATRCVMMLPVATTNRGHGDCDATGSSDTAAPRRRVVLCHRAPGRPSFRRRPSAVLTLPMTGIAAEDVTRAYILDRDHRFCYASAEPGAAALRSPPYKCRKWLATKHSGHPPVLPALGPHDDGEEVDDKRFGWRCHPCRRGTRGVHGGGAPIVMLQPWWQGLLGMCG
jgi:hypothetical protein